MKNLTITLCKAAVTALLLYVVLRRVDLHEFSTVLQGARFQVLLAALAVLCAGHFLCVFRWRMLMRPVLPALPLKDLWQIYFIGVFFNLAFPTAVGGDLVKMYYAGRPSGRFAQSFAATFLDRDLGMLAMMVLACVAELVRPIYLPGLPVRFVIWSIFFGLIFANIAIFTPPLQRFFTRMIHRMHLPGMAARVEALSGTFRVMAKNWTVLVNSFAVSLVNQLLAVLMSWVLSKALRLNVSFFDFLIIVPVVMLFSMIPVSLNGMGLREYAFVNLLAPVGIAREFSVALGLTLSALTFLSGIPGGVIYMFFRNRTDIKRIASLEADLSLREES